MIDTIADMGARGEWDFATVCMGINVLRMPEPEFRQRVRYAVEEISGKNPEKHVFFISPIFCRSDLVGEPFAARWREIVEEEVARVSAPCAHYVNGLDLLGDPSGLSCDYVHPSPLGIDRITAKLIEKMSEFVW